MQLLSLSFLLSGLHQFSLTSLDSSNHRLAPSQNDATMALHLIEEHGARLPRKANESHVRLVVLSDTHGRHSELPPLPDGDVLLHLGDVADRGNVHHIRSFINWIENQSYHRSFNEIVCIGGNHDRDRRNPQLIDLEKEFSMTSIIYLQDEHCDLAQGRLRVYGASWDACERDDFRKMGAEHNDVTLPPDIFLTHSNPFVSGGGHGWKGSKEITRTVNRHQIPLHLFGHVHWGRGTKVLNQQRDAATKSVMVNCATTWNEPVVIDWDPVSREATMVYCPKPNLIATAGKLFMTGNKKKALV